MRRDRIIFDGTNPFDYFSDCKEFTVILQADRVVLVGTVNDIQVVKVFNSTVSFVDEEEEILNKYTIPLSLIVPIFRLDDRDKANILVIETYESSVEITYNEVSVSSILYSANSSTVNVLDSLNTDSSIEVSPSIFTMVTDSFGSTKEEFCHIDGRFIFISSPQKALVSRQEVDLDGKYSIPIKFIRMMKKIGATSLNIGNHLVAMTENGTFLIETIKKLQDPSTLEEFKFASRVLTNATYTLKINKYMKQINAALGSKELSVILDLGKGRLLFKSNSGESLEIELEKDSFVRQVPEDIDFKILDQLNSLTISDASVIKSIAVHRSVEVKFCGNFFIAKLNGKQQLMFEAVK